MVGLKFKALFNSLYQPTEFKTGPGACGKIVTHFTTSRDERTLTIHQHHTDGSQKDYMLRLSDIDGRIQYDYEQVKVYGQEAERERAIQAFTQVRPRIILPLCLPLPLTVKIPCRRTYVRTYVRTLHACMH
ncbi:hypothetical protein LS3_10 [Escherichia virus LS3]|uniref:Uncharacterized protein n=1 Tax=Escherichia virus LS3 TaxID=2743777 RepID=A0ACD4R0Q7_9CAUD